MLRGCPPSEGLFIFCSPCGAGLCGVVVSLKTRKRVRSCCAVSCCGGLTEGLRLIDGAERSGGARSGERRGGGGGAPAMERVAPYGAETWRGGATEGRRENAKNRGGVTPNRPPTPLLELAFRRGAVGVHRGVIPTLLPSNKIYYLCSKHIDMKMKLNLSQSVYANSSNGAGPGLTVQGGRLINSRPNSEMGIVQAANARREMKRERKIQTYAEAYARGERMAEMDEMMRSMSSCCGKPNCDC